MLSTLNPLKCRIDFWTDHYTVLCVSSITLQRQYSIYIYWIFTFIYEGSVWKNPWLWIHNKASKWDCYLISYSISFFLLILFITLKFILPFSSFLNQNFSWDGILHIFKTHQACNSNRYKNKPDTLSLEKDLTAIQSWHFSGRQRQADSSHSPRIVDFYKSCGHTQFFLTLHQSQSGFDLT